jgi:hypothetical protein
VSVNTTVIQHAAPRDTRTPEQIKAHFVELQKAVWAACEDDPADAEQSAQLPPSTAR